VLRRAGLTWVAEEAGPEADLGDVGLALEDLVETHDLLGLHGVYVDGHVVPLESLEG